MVVGSIPTPLTSNFINLRQRIEPQSCRLSASTPSTQIPVSANTATHGTIVADGLPEDRRRLASTGIVMVLRRRP
jgi:hypothetical protein